MILFQFGHPISSSFLKSCIIIKAHLNIEYGLDLLYTTTLKGIWLLSEFDFRL